MQDDIPVDGEPCVKRCRHETVPAMTFPYELDAFQRDSINALENGDSVLVSAHTSAGKTTVALYAIAKAVREKKRVIYTSPIKALSNQKFREFTDKFDSVGLMTGDTTIKVDSDCLVMTTEILRSMLYRGTEMLREVGCVVFDEVHYMRDKSRGVVWEETISLLPEGCQYVFLSATIPNAREFAEWVESIHPGTKVHVIHTDYRPVPLHHYVYPCGADGIFLIVDELGKFREDNFRRAMASVGAGNKGGDANGAESTEVAAASRGKQRSMRKSTEPIMEIIKLVMNRNMYPIIVFSFAKAECERNALALSKLNFNNTEEDALVTEVFNNAMECLATEDRKLPAIEHLLPLLKRGVGIHHSGLLPILKEVVEILFQAGLVKVLFSTETFSMGLNMPARTVVFTSVKKFDGETNRYLTGGEYIQMSGRAGRRGLDRVGVVIAMVDEAVEPEILKQVTGGGADVLNSSFHLTYNMVLNLLRVEDVDPEFMMRRSFAQFQRLRNRPALEMKAEELTKDITSICVEHEEMFRQYAHCQEQLEKKRKQIGDFLKQPVFIRRFTNTGRLLRIRRSTDGALFNWGICRSSRAKTSNADEKDPSSFSVDALVICRKADPSQPTQLVPCHVKDHTINTVDLYTVTFDFTDIEAVSRFRVNLPADLDSASSRAEVIQSLEKLYKNHGDDVPLLTSEELGVKDPKFKKLCEQLGNIEKQVQKCELVCNPTEALEADYESFKKRASLERELDAIKQELDQVTQAIFSDELKKMMRVLRRLDYIDKDNIILRKARVACEITTSDENELLLTELLFKGVLNSMETEMIVALMSCLVNVHRTPDGFSLPEEFRQPLNDLNEIVNRIATLSIESGITQENTSVEKTMPSLMEVTYLWAKGAKFSDIVTKTNAYEGDIVRMMRRLEEQLRQMAGAARSPAIGCMELHDKFLKGIQLIKRDIVFASSLYL
ncbi:ATP-dependent DEAD/H RNA helicase, putative [Trypanosoma brucei gambiense DAL972]|uniref:ATP-dependent DEAD/H RNA helicase, putative n=2 Tax=Trypanosoma brucei TaxID=5691 RepID=D0A3H7_TRYB9|nr:ATP-dependent DEAD/H RNA helicase, putative [Trypanosoma brucei gambiense DAL972]RHW69246.1 ATP-dependent RNA helicase MTR4 [Trypanosoma brucei equiperdum]CBH15821.1 ATP-dependent DEAD/H RNA helicase, putative [Trypanosoma brucei gambiense DAL972]|eukprot:XP_011778085.1 ATP-dependent DEAD/H RNA helicase, putative [Trypanosoma brucei gambiense DAL972]